MQINRMRLELGAIATAGFYSSQEERKKAMNRVRQIIYRAKEGKEMAVREKKKEEKEKSYGKEYNDNNLARLIPVLEAKNKISKEDSEYLTKIFDVFDEMKGRENTYKAVMTDIIEVEPIYVKFLKNIKGIGTLNTANLLQYFGYCEKAKHASSLWKFSGYDVVNGKAPAFTRGVEANFNPKLRSLIWRIGDCFIKQRTPQYRPFYDKEKKRQLKLMKECKCLTCKKSPEKHKKKGTKYYCKDGKEYSPSIIESPMSLGHADARARRYMVKRFMVDYYNACLLIRGIQPEKPYMHRKD